MTEPRERVSRFNRTAPRTQALLSAALLLPTLAIYAPIGLNNDFFVEFAFAASGGYFLAALAVVARSAHGAGGRWRLPRPPWSPRG